MAVQVAVDGLALRIGQGRKPLFAHETFHSGQFHLPFRHCPEPRVRDPMRHSVVAERLEVTGSTTLREHPSIGSVQVRDARKHSAAPSDPQKCRQSDGKSARAPANEDSTLRPARTRPLPEKGPPNCSALRQRPHDLRHVLAPRWLTPARRTTSQMSTVLHHKRPGPYYGVSWPPTCQLVQTVPPYGLLRFISYQTRAVQHEASTGTSSRHTARHSTRIR